MLCEVLIAAAVGLILFGAAFACFRQAMYSMKRAEAIRAATTVGKDVMERSRAGLSSQHDSMLQKNTVLRLRLKRSGQVLSENES